MRVFEVRIDGARVDHVLPLSGITKTSVVGLEANLESIAAVFDHAIEHGAVAILG